MYVKKSILRIGGWQWCLNSLMAKRGVGVNKNLCYMYELNHFSVIKLLFEIKYISLACSGWKKIFVNITWFKWYNEQYLQSTDSKIETTINRKLFRDAMSMMKWRLDSTDFILHIVIIIELCTVKNKNACVKKTNHQFKQKHKPCIDLDLETYTTSFISGLVLKWHLFFC